MEVRHRFARIRAVIDHQSITAFVQTERFGYFCRFQQQVAEDLVIIGFRFGNSWNDVFRNDQDMNRRSRLDIPKREDEIVFVDDLRRDLPGRNLFEQGLAHATPNDQFTSMAQSAERL